MAGDLYWESVALAFHMDDAGLTDVKGNAVTLNGGVTRSATQSKFGGYSAFFDGTNDELYNNVETIVPISQGAFSAEFWCRPSAQVQSNPMVFRLQHIGIEYKPSGYTDGFVINSEGVRTACGVFAEDTWHYIAIRKTSTTCTVYINGVFITTISSGDEVYTDNVLIGSNFIGTFADSAFTGYIDDVRITMHVIRTEYDVPVATFPDFLPDPEGAVSGALVIDGAVVGYVVPLGALVATMRFTCEVVGSVPTNGHAYGNVKFKGLAQGVVGYTGIVFGNLVISGAATGSMGKFGPASGSIRFTGLSTGSHGVSGSGLGAIYLTGSGIGSTPLVPVGIVNSSLRFTGYARGLGAPVLEDLCA